VLRTGTALGIFTSQVHDLIARHRPAITAHGGDMREQLDPTLLRLNKAKTFVVIPAA
jgi:hypothetical protein